MRARLWLKAKPDWGGSYYSDQKGVTASVCAYGLSQFFHDVGEFRAVRRIRVAMVVSDEPDEHSYPCRFYKSRDLRGRVSIKSGSDTTSWWATQWFRTLCHKALGTTDDDELWGKTVYWSAEIETYR